MSVAIPGLSAERQAAENETKLMEEWGEWNDGLGEILQKNPEPEGEDGVLSVGDIGSQVYEWCKDNTKAVGKQILQYAPNQRDRRPLRPIRRKATSPKLRPGPNHGGWHRASLSAGLSKLSSYLGLGGARRKKRPSTYDDDYEHAGPVPPLRRTRSAATASNPSEEAPPPLTKSRSESFQNRAEREGYAQPPLVRSQTWDAGIKRTSSGGSSARRRAKPLSSVSEHDGPRQLPKVTEEVIKALFCPPYYLWMGAVLMSFVTDNVHDLASFPEERKKLTLVLLAMSVVNLFSVTTTPRSHLAFLALRAVCDVLNVLHAGVLLLVSIWAVSLPPDLRALALWFSRSPSLSGFLGVEEGHSGAVLGVAHLLLGLVRVAHDLHIDTNPLLHEVPHMVAGLLLFALVPCNVGRGDSGWQAPTPLPWCKCHVLTTAMAVGLLNLGAPPHRSVGAPLVVMVLTSLWALGVACAGVTMGPAAVPWPGIPLFAILSVVCLLLSKHT
mmetsp:Transcript_60462/g.142648  ORF Transcript_60462/g.142648 Transcript_60462/m.142648 type:complete len:497 (-) Transcript_60462:158-1648(-)